MHLVILDYTAELSAMDGALEAHAAWLDEQYEAGLFLASGRREPRTGGVILARGERSAIEAAVAKDPFAVQGLAEHTIIEFHPSKFGDPLDTEEIRTALG